MLPFATTAKQIRIYPSAFSIGNSAATAALLAGIYPTGNSIDNEANKKREIYKSDDKVTWCKGSIGLVGESVEWLRSQESVRKRKVVTRYYRIISLFHAILACILIHRQLNVCIFFALLLPPLFVATLCRTRFLRLSVSLHESIAWQDRSSSSDTFKKKTA
jgi:hypothetical protein